MKKITIFLVLIIEFIGIYCYTYSQNKISKNNIIANNNEYTALLDTEITGTNFASIINKVMDQNLNNNVEKDSDGIFLDNGTNSINIEIKFKDTDKVVKAEKIFNYDIRNFIKVYGNYKFKCTKIDYHKKTKYVKYMFFEEV